MKSHFTISPASKIFLGICIAITTFVTGANHWLNIKNKNATDYTPWTLVAVETGDLFTVSNNNETKTITLCGVEASGDKAKDYLQRIINQGNGTVIFEEAGNSHEAWITFEPNYDVELLKNLPDKIEEGSEINIHLNTWMIEQGFARQNPLNSKQCHEPDRLAWAEDIAKENKLGIWQEQ